MWLFYTVWCQGCHAGDARLIAPHLRGLMSHDFSGAGTKWVSSGSTVGQAARYKTAPCTAGQVLQLLVPDTAGRRHVALIWQPAGPRAQHASCAGLAWHYAHPVLCLLASGRDYIAPQQQYGSPSATRACHKAASPTKHAPPAQRCDMVDITVQPATLCVPSWQAGGRSRRQPDQLPVKAVLQPARKRSSPNCS
jgi:hypothetical protein